MLLEKDGITRNIVEPAEIARLKRLGYKEVRTVQPAPLVTEAADETTPELENEKAIKEANKQIGSKRGKQ